jgi:hypothetical protein
MVGGGISRARGPGDGAVDRDGDFSWVSELGRIVEWVYNAPEERSGREVGVRGDSAVADSSFAYSLAI